MPRQKIGAQISFTAPAELYIPITAQAAENHRSVAKEMRAILWKYFKLPGDEGPNV